MMFWKRWFARSENHELRGLREELSHKKTIIDDYYQSSLASQKKVRDLQKDGQELKQQLAHKTDLEAAQKTAYERESARAADLELISERRMETCLNLGKRLSELESLNRKMNGVRALEIGALDERIAELTRGQEYFKQQYLLASRVLADISGMIIQYQSASDKSPTVAESPIGDSVGEETQVIDKSQVEATQQ